MSRLTHRKKFQRRWRSAENSPNFILPIQKKNNKFLKFVLFFVVINLAYYFVYYFFLQQTLSFLGVSFYILTLVFYIIISNFTKNYYLRIFRLILVAFLLFFNLINFIHFKNLSSFLVLGKGFILGISVPLMHLLFGFLYQIPFALAISSLVLFIVFLWFDFATIKIRLDFKKSLVLLFLCVFAVFSLTFYNVKNPSQSWSSAAAFHSEFGPAGYLYPEFLKKIILKEPVTATAYSFNGKKSSYLSYTRNALQSLSSLREKTLYKEPLLPEFKKSPRIIFYQLESTSTWAINQNPTPMPFLKKLMQNNITVDHFYGNDCHTIGSEFTSLCSLMPDSREIISSRIDPPEYKCLPKILDEKFGYLTAMYHSNVPSFWSRDKLIPLWGIKEMYFSPYFRPKDSDEIVTKEMVNNILEKKSVPTFDYFIGYTAHAPHTKGNIYMQLIENKLEIVPYPYKLNSIAEAIDLPSNELRNYLGFLTAQDEALRKMFVDLGKANELDNTIIVVFGDHRYYGFKNNNIKFLSEFAELPFVMQVPGMKSLKIPIIASHIDIAPTILNLISKIDINAETHYIGQSIFSNNHFNQALGKCGDEIYYFNPDITLGGDFGLNVYSTIKKPASLSLEMEKEYYTRLSNAVYYSNELISYPVGFNFPDGSLVKGSSKSVYIIDQGKKRLLSSEDVFHAMGFAWNDIHKISDKWLSEYETSDDFTFEDVYLIKKPKDEMPVVEAKSVLRPSSGIKNNQIIAHAFGGIKKASGTNSREAFIENYEKGIRFFEVDLSLTADGAVVAFHDGNESNIGLNKKISQTTLEEFKQHKFLGEYTLLDFQGILDLMKEYPDSYIITDTKGDLHSILSQVVSLTKNFYPEALNRIIPQIYQERDIQTVNNIFDFKDLIYTLYRTNANDDDVLRFVTNNGSKITGVTMWWDKRFNENIKDQLQALDIGVFVHTLNNDEDIKKFIKKGVGVYTDFYAE